VKKFLVTLLIGAFLFTSLAATVGCGEEKDKGKDKTTKDKDKDKDKDKKTDK
jgi:hypothetical protein